MFVIEFVLLLMLNYIYPIVLCVKLISKIKYGHSARIVKTKKGGGLSDLNNISVPQYD